MGLAWKFMFSEKGLVTIYFEYVCMYMCCKDGNIDARNIKMKMCSSTIL